MFRGPLLLISIFAVILSHAPCRGGEIILKLRDFADRPIPGLILKFTPAEDAKSSKTTESQIPAPQGDGKISDAKCDPPGIIFRATSYDQTYFLEVTEMMKSCVLGEIVFHFRQKDYASLLAIALSDQYALKSTSGKARTLYQTTMTALAGSNFAEAATTSMLLRDQIAKELGPKAAEPYRVLATDIAASPITGVQPLIYDAEQRKFVLSTEAVQTVAKYQKSKGLPATGTLDWNTALSLPDTGAHFIAMTPGNAM